MVAGDASTRTTTSTDNTIATKHSHLVMRVLTGGSMSTRSKFAHECKVAYGQYRKSRALHERHMPTENLE